MDKITGIKSVDFKVTAKGHGVVNWNGPTNLMGDEGRTVDNHTLPKLRGYSNLSGRVNENGYKYKKQAQDIDFTKTPLYVSQNCIRHHLFREQSYDLHFATNNNLPQVIASETGLIRGYVVPASQSKRTSALLLEDFVDQLGNGNFEQFGQAGERDSSSFFSKTTFGDTEYLSYGSISAEQLQFISLDRKFDRAAMDIVDGQGPEIATAVQDYILTLDHSSGATATFHPNYVRRGSIFTEGEQGILLNDQAQLALVRHTLDKIANLVIRQAKSYLYVDDLLVDYNDSYRMMRIKQDESEISEQPTGPFACYFNAS